MGIIGEYVGRLYEEVKARPLYIIGKTVGWPPPRTLDAPAPEPAANPPVTPTSAAPTKDGIG